MTKSFAAKTLRVLSVVALASCFGESTGPDMGYARFSIAPQFDLRGLNAVDVNRVRVLVTRLGGSPTLVDTTVNFPASQDTLDLSVSVVIQGSQEDLELSMFMLDDPGGVVVFQSGPDVFTAVAGASAPVPVVAVPLYVGPGSQATGVRFIGAQPGAVYFNDSVTFVAEAFDASNAVVPNAPIVWSTSDTTRAVMRADTMGRVIARAARGTVNVTAELLRTSPTTPPPSVSGSLAVQPVASQIVLVNGGGQSGPPGTPLPAPVVVQVRAADNLGVAGVIVNFAVTAGAGSVNPQLDTTDAGGNASTSWTLGTGGVGQSISATVQGLPAATVSVPATATAGPATQLAFTVMPATVVSGVAISPAIQVTARDANSLTATGFAGNVTLALATNPAGGTLSGTLTQAAVGGVATFSNVSIDNIAAGYTFLATAPGLTAATSSAIGVTAPAGVNAWVNPAGGNWNTAANWSMGTVPGPTDTVFIKASGNYTVSVDVNSTVARLEVGGPSGNQTLQLLTSTLTLNGPGVFNANSQLTLNGGALRGTGTLTTAGGFTWLGGQLGGDNGTISVGGVLTIGGAATRTFISHTLEVAGPGTWTGTATFNTGIAATIRVLAGATLDVQGDPSFVYNQGGAISRLDVQGTLMRSTSAGVFAVGAAVDNSGAVNIASGSMGMSNGGTSSGTFNLGAAGTLAFNGGVHNLSVSSAVQGVGNVTVGGGTVNVAGAWNITTTGITTISGGALNYSGTGTGMSQNLTLTGTGTLGGSVTGLMLVPGTMTWSGGNLNGTGGMVRVPAGGVLNITGAGARQLVNYTLELGGNGTWSGTHTLNSGSVGTMRVLAGGNLDIQGSPTFAFNQGGSIGSFEHQGSVLKSVGGVATFNVPYNLTGGLQLTAGSFSLAAGGALSGTVTAGPGTAVDYTGGTFVLANPFNTMGVGPSRWLGGTMATATATDTAHFQTLIIDGATVNHSGVVRPSVQFNWISGTINGTGKLLVPSPATFSITGAATRTFTNGVIENNTSASWTGTGTINTGIGAVLRNMPGAQFSVQSDASFLSNQGGTTTVFDNQGTFSRIVSAGAATWTVQFNQASTASTLVNPGSLVLSGGGTQSGTFSVGAGAFLDYSGGGYTFSAHLASGAGTVRWLAGTMVTATAADTARFTNLQLNGGTVSVSGVLVADTLLDWAGSTTINGTGKVLIPVSGQLTITGGSTRTFTNGIIENNGVVLWTGAGTINTGIGAIVRNMAGASFNLDGDGQLLSNQGGLIAQFDNLGFFGKTTGTAAITWTAAFNHTGGATSILSTPGLSLSGGGTISAPMTVNTGVALFFAGGTFTLANGNNFTGAGTGTVNWSGATLNTASASDTAHFGTPFTNLSAGTWSHTGVVRLANTAGWFQGDITGSGKVLSAVGSFSITGTGARTFTNGIIEIAGTATWNNTGNVNSGQGAIMRVLPGATFTHSSDGQFLSNQGGTQALFDNQGTFNRTTSSNTLIWSAFYQDTVGATSVQSNVFQLQGGGRFGGTGKSVTGTNVLQLAAGTFTVRPGTSFTGTGTVAVVGATLAPDSASAVAPATNAVSFQNLSMGSGTIGHEGLLVVNGTLTLAGGTISSNFGGAAGLGGTTRSGGTLNITTSVGAITFIGPHTLDILGATNYSGALNINTGQGAIINNAGLWTWSADGQILSNQGGTPLTFNNLAAGTLRRSTSATTALLDAVINKLGPIDFAAGGQGLALTRGSVSNFGGAVTGAGGLGLGGGTFTTTANLTVAGALTVTAGSLVFAGANRNVSVGAQFSTTGTGTISMTAATDSLDIGGNAIFSGGTSTLSAGVMRLAGSLTQSVQLNAFAPTGTHRTVLDGAGVQTISFTNTANSFFNFLEVNKAGGQVTFATNARTVRSLRIITPTLVGGGAARVIVGDSVTSPVSGSDFVPLVAEIGMGLRDSGNFSPDTTVFTGASQIVPFAASTPYNYNSIRIAQSSGTATFGFNPVGVNAIPNDLIVSSGTLNITGRQFAVTGNFRTEGSGALQMTGATDSLGVGGNITFGGGSTAGLMTAGAVTANGDFTQGGGAANAYAPSGTHRTRFIRPGSAVVQTVSFANPTTSFFDSLELNRGAGTRGTVNFTTDARVNSGMVIQNSTDMTGATARIVVAGGTVTIPQVTTSGTLSNVLAVELSLAPVIGPGAPLFSPDTTVYVGTIATMPVQAQIQYKSIRVNTSGNFGLATDTITGDLDVATGTAVFAGGFLQLGGKLRTRGAGALSMIAGASAPNIFVTDSAIFGGGSTAGLLTTGNLFVRGNFFQGGGNAAAFAPSGAHRTVFDGNAPGVHTIAFTNPSTSFFRRLTLDKQPGSGQTVRMATNVLVTDSLLTQNASELISTTTERITVQGTYRYTGVTNFPTVHPFAMELNVNPTMDTVFPGAVRFFPDTLVFTGTASYFMPFANYVGLRSVRHSSTGNMTHFATGPNDTLIGDLVVTSGRFVVQTSLSVQKFRLSGTGGFNMNQAGVTFTVRDSAIFAGASNNPNLNFGTLRARGHVVQAGDPASLNGDPPWTFEFAGTAPQTVRFTNPGFTAALSHFGVVRFANTAGVTFQTPVFTHILEDVTGGTQETTFGAGFLMTAEGLNVNNARFDNMPLSVVDNQAVSVFNNVTFQNYAAGDIMTLARTAPIAAFNTVTFPTAGFTGRYLVANDPNGATSGVLNVTIQTATPALPGTQCQRVNGALITWNGTNVLTC